MLYYFCVKKHLFFLVICLFSASTFAQVTGSITVGGDINRFYPTVWNDSGWPANVPSELEIGRSETHTNSSWRGALIAEFKYHTNAYGNGANFIDANIRQMWNKGGEHFDFVAGWKDSSRDNHSNTITIWLRGGGTTYYYKSLFANTPKVYDGVANPLPFVEENGPSHTYKITKDPYVNSNGLSQDGTGFFTSSGLNYFAGNVGIGTTDTKSYKLAVAGNMVAESIKVSLQSAWPDYVFDKNYEVTPLAETEKFINKFGHLPGVPSADVMKEKGLDVGEMNILLMKKIEELTLLLIEQDKRIKLLEGAAN